MKNQCFSRIFQFFSHEISRSTNMIIIKIAHELAHMLEIVRKRKYLEKIYKIDPKILDFGRFSKVDLGF